MIRDESEYQDRLRELSDLLALQASEPWKTLIAPAFLTAYETHLAGSTNLSIPAADRGEHDHAFALAKRLLELVPGRINVLRGEATKFRDQHEGRVAQFDEPE